MIKFNLSHFTVTSRSLKTIYDHRKRMENPNNVNAISTERKDPCFHLLCKLIAGCQWKIPHQLSGFPSTSALLFSSQQSSLHMQIYFFIHLPFVQEFQLKFVIFLPLVSQFSCIFFAIFHRNFVNTRVNNAIELEIYYSLLANLHWQIITCLNYKEIVEQNSFASISFGRWAVLLHLLLG